MIANLLVLDFDSPVTGSLADFGIAAILVVIASRFAATRPIAVALSKSGDVSPQEQPPGSALAGQEILGDVKPSGTTG